MQFVNGLKLGRQDKVKPIQTSITEDIGESTTNKPAYNLQKNLPSLTIHEEPHNGQ
jgi:hypothetical protein